MTARVKRLIVLKIAIEGRLHDAWNAWNNPDDIIGWYKGHKDWNTVEASNTLKIGEYFSYEMISSDQKHTFTLVGCYSEIDKYKNIKYIMEDERMVDTSFYEMKNKVIIIQKVELEENNSEDSQALWWRTILTNFKKYLEN